MTLTRPRRSIRPKILTPLTRMRRRHHLRLRPSDRLQTSLLPLPLVAVLRRPRRPRRARQPPRPHHSRNTRPTTLSHHSHLTTPPQLRPTRLRLYPQGPRRLSPRPGPCHLRRLSSQADQPTMPGKACRVRRVRRGASRSTRHMPRQVLATSQVRLRTFTDRALLTKQQRSSPQGAGVQKADCVLSGAQIFAERDPLGSELVGPSSRRIPHRVVRK